VGGRAVARVGAQQCRAAGGGATQRAPLPFSALLQSPLGGAHGIHRSTCASTDVGLQEAWGGRKGGKVWGYGHEPLGSHNWACQSCSVTTSAPGGVTVTPYRERKVGSGTIETNGACTLGALITERTRRARIRVKPVVAVLSIGQFCHNFLRKAGADIAWGAYTCNL
jgi:hypothetical protein